MEELIDIGRIVAPHGLGGEVKIEPLTDFPERFEELEEALLTSPSGVTKPVRITRCRYWKRQVIAKLEGVDGRDQAETLRKGILKVPRSQVYQLPPGRYYVFELVGLRVYTTQEEYVGKISDVLFTGANDVYVVDPPQAEGNPGSRAQILIPAVKQIVKEIDVKAGRMTIEPVPGLLDS